MKYLSSDLFFFFFVQNPEKLAVTVGPALATDPDNPTIFFFIHLSVLTYTAPSTSIL